MAQRTEEPPISLLTARTSSTDRHKHIKIYAFFYVKSVTIYITVFTEEDIKMKSIRTFILMTGFVALVTVLFDAHAALAIDGAAQTESFIKNIVKTLVSLAGAVAVVFIVIGGYHYITSSGHPEKLDKAKKTLLYSGLGLVIVLAAYTIVDFVAGIAKSSFGS